MNDGWLVAALKDSKTLVDKAFGDDVSDLTKAMLIAKVLELKASGEMRVLARQEDVAEETSLVFGDLEINELFRIVNPKTHTERLAICGFYLASRNIDTFNNNGIRALYGKCKERLPKNLSDATSSAIAQGYLAELEDKGEDGSRIYSLTSTGRRFVLNKLGDHNVGP